MTTTPTDADGTIEEAGGGLVLRFDRWYRNSIDDVWDALTNPQRLAQWWLPFAADITIDLRPGGAYVLRGTDEGAPTMTFEVLRAEPPHRFEHTHVEPDIIVTWELAERDGGCALTFTQTVPDRARAIDDNFAVGMHTSFDRLRALLDGAPIAWDWDAFGAHQRRYVAAGLATASEGN